MCRVNEPGQTKDVEHSEDPETEVTLWTPRSESTEFNFLLSTHRGEEVEVKWSEVAQSCPTLCDLMDCSLPDSSVHGIFQARILEWVAISFSRGTSRPRDQTWVSHIVGRHFTVWATRGGRRESPNNIPNILSLSLSFFQFDSGIGAGLNTQVEVICIYLLEQGGGGTEIRQGWQADTALGTPQISKPCQL